MSGLQRAIEHFNGNQTALADALGVHRANITNWKKRRCVPAAWALEIEKVTAGAVKRSEIRPDLYPADA